MTRLLAIDPGPVTCGVVLLDCDEWPPTVVIATAKAELEAIRVLARNSSLDRVVVEWITSYGMPVGAETFDTCAVVGRIEETCDRSCVACERLSRHDVKLTLCHSSRAKDSNVRRAILDLYPATGGGKTPQVGIKAKRGPLYGVEGHAMAALAVGLAWLRRER